MTAPTAVVPRAPAPPGGWVPPHLATTAAGSSGSRRRDSAREPSSPAQIISRRVGVVVTAIGMLATLLLVYEFKLSSIPAQRTQAELLATFKQAVPTTTLDQSSAALTEGSAVALLRIPRLGIDQVVVEGSTPTDTKRGPGHLSASPLPGEYGNAVIEGRRTTYGGPFANLDSVRKGDKIDATTGQGVFTYTVSKVAHLSPGDKDVVSGSSDSRLTLMTSDPAFFATGRLAVVATLNGDPIAVPHRPPQLEDEIQLGVAGDPLGLALGLVWLLLLAIAGYTAWRLRDRMPRSVLYLYAAPVITALALLTYANLDSLLPGTM